MQRCALRESRVNRVDNHFVSRDQLTEFVHEHAFHSLRRRISFLPSRDAEGPRLVERRNQGHGVAIGKLGSQGQAGRDDAQATRMTGPAGLLQHGKQKKCQQSSGQVVHLHRGLVACRRFDLPAVHLPVSRIEEGNVQARQGLASPGKASDGIIVQHVKCPDPNVHARMCFTEQRRSLLPLCKASDSHDKMRQVVVKHDFCASKPQASVAAGDDCSLASEGDRCWGALRLCLERSIDEASSLASMVWG